MTDIDTLATEARRKAQGEIALVEVPETEQVMGERRRRHAVRNGIAAVAIVAVLGVGVGAAVAASNGGGTPMPDVAVAPVGDRVTLQFRAVEAEFECDSGAPTTKPPQPGVEIVRDHDGEQCYVLGPTLMDGTSLADVEVVYNDSYGGYEITLKFGNDDFVQKVGERMVGTQVAVVVDGIVYSAPTIGEGITGREVTVSGDFDAETSRTLAAALRGVPESEVEVPPTTPEVTMPDSQLPRGFELVQGPGCGLDLGYSQCKPETWTQDAAQLRSVSLREDAELGWVIDITLRPGTEFNTTDPAQVLVDGVLLRAAPTAVNAFAVIPDANDQARAQQFAGQISELMQAG